MRVVHRFGVASRDAESRSLLTSLGLHLTDHKLTWTFDIEESDPRWPAIAAWSERRGDPGSTRTIFTNAEVRTARWLQLSPTWHYGYPQPDDLNFGYLRQTYDLSDWCETCGVGARQVRPFEMKKEPAWGRNSLLQMNWVFDEFFATPRLWEDVMRPQGVPIRPVLGAHGQELDSVVQLVAEQTVPIVTDGLAPERCVRCDRVKYLPISRGMFPPLVSEPRASMVKTADYFGSGASAHRGVLVSADIAAALTSGKVKGATLVPVAS